MEYVNLGKTGLKVSRLCLGCMSFGIPDRGYHGWSLDEEQSRTRRSCRLGYALSPTPMSAKVSPHVR